MCLYEETLLCVHEGRGYRVNTHVRRSGPLCVHVSGDTTCVTCVFMLGGAFVCLNEEWVPLLSRLLEKRIF